MKHIKLTFLLTILMSMVGAKAFAHDIEVKNADGVTIYYCYNSDKTSVYVSYRGGYYHSYSNEYQGVVNIPSSITYNGKEYSVTRIGDYAFEGCSGLTSVTIGNSVTSIGDYAFYNCSGLKSVTIPNSVTSIGSSAFEGCSGLTSVTIGNSVKSIGNDAFSYCSGLTSVTIPYSVTSIGGYAFYGCSKLTSVTLNSNAIASKTYTSSNNIKNIFGEQVTEYIIGEDVTSIGGSAFYGCSKLTSVTLNSNAIASKTYTSSNNIKNIFGGQVKEYIIGEDVTSIGSYAFDGCTDLTSVTIPNSVTSIGYYAFQNCSGLTSVTIPNSVESIGAGAFSGCSGLTSVTLNSNAIASKTYTNSNNIKNIFGKQVTEYIIGEDVTSIGGYAFYGCAGLTSITIGNSVTSIGGSAFYGCSKLTSVTLNSNAIASKTYTSSNNIKNIFGKQVTEYIIGEDVTSIGGYAFYGCAGLTSITIGNSVTSIGSWAFSGCSKLTSVTLNSNDIASKTYTSSNIKNIFGEQVTEYIIGEDVTSIGSWAFDGCTGLTSVTIGNSVTSIGRWAFSGCSGLKKVIVKDIAAWCGISFESSYANPLYYAKHLYSDDNTEITDLVIPDGVTSIGSYAFAYCYDLTSVTIPNSVTSIGYYAFQNCSDLTSVTIPNSVTSIGGSAFEGCSGLTSVTIPNSVESIGAGAFSGCSGLTSVEIPNSVTSIGYFAFEYCYGLKKVIVKDIAAWCRISFGGYYANPLYYAKHLYSDENTEITDLVIPDGVTSIGAGAFWNCDGLTSVTIPNSVTSIGSDAFSGCSGLTEITSNIQEPFATADCWGGVDKSIPLYVPAGTKEEYQSTNGWKDFTNIIEKEETTGIESLTSDPSLKGEESGNIYSLDGRKVSNSGLSKGIYIKNGKKVVMK